MTFQQACYSYEIRKGLLYSCPVTLNPEGFSQVSSKFMLVVQPATKLMLMGLCESKGASSVT